MTAREISEHIFYLPATNGKADSSIETGADLIEGYAKEKAALVWRATLEPYYMLVDKEFDQDREARLFNEWWENNK